MIVYYYSYIRRLWCSVTRRSVRISTLYFPHVSDRWRHEYNFILLLFFLRTIAHQNFDEVIFYSYLPFLLFFTRNQIRINIYSKISTNYVMSQYYDPRTSARDRSKISWRRYSHIENGETELKNHI